MKKTAISTLILVFVLSMAISPVLAQDVDIPNTSGDSSAKYIPGELLIRFSPWMDSAQVANQMANMGVASKRNISALGVHLVKLPKGLSVEQAIARFDHMSGVIYAEPNYVMQIAATSQAELDPTWGLNKIHAPEAWSYLDENSQQNEVLLATVDTGVDFSQSDISSRQWANPDEIPGDGIDNDHNGYVDDSWGWDFVNNDNDPTDDNMHGTAVSGVMTATGPGVQGVCPWCKVMAVKVLGANGSGTLDVVANGITYAANNGARVINLSLAGGVGAQTLEDAVDFAWGKGTLVVAAAGNDGRKITVYPAGYDNAMAVGSTNSEDKHSCFSNYNDNYISVTAPGEAIYVIDINDTATGYNYYSGTSLAAPHVSGLAGLIFGQNPERTNTQVLSIIQDSAVDLGSVGFDPVFGHGRIDADRAVHEDYSQVDPPDGLYSNSDTASGYTHARKLVRDGNGVLHLIWHTYDDTRYRIRYATSVDDGEHWVLKPDVFTSPYETYHPALAADNEYLYVAYPSRGGVNSPYQILFTRKSITGGSWSPAVSLMGGTYNAVRPQLYLDPTNGRLHLIASSYDDAPYLYYLASNNPSAPEGTTWGPLSQFNPSNTTSNLTRYAVLHANGDNLYVVTRTRETVIFFTYLNMFTVRSTDGGQTWTDQTHISAHLALTSDEYGISMAGIGDRVFMSYEWETGLYFRRNDGNGWSDYLPLETGDANNIYKWPSITQAPDGQAWMIFELNKQLYMRHYDGSNWEPKESLGPGTYANLKLDSSDGQLEWVYTSCNGSPFDLNYGSRLIGTSNNPPVANDDTGSVEEGGTLNVPAPGVLDNDSDPEGDSLTVTTTPVNPPNNGSLILSTDGSYSYTHDGSETTSDSFVYQVCDDGLLCDTATVNLSITPVNDPPVANDDTGSVEEGGTLNVPAPGVLGNDSDPEGGSLTVSTTPVTPPNYGNVTLNADGSYSYTHDGSQTTSDSFVYQVCDDGLLCDTATATITVTPAVTVVDAFANGEIFIAGTVSGDYTDTYTDSYGLESITEIESNGKPQNRFSYLEHKWTFNVTPGNPVTLYANTWSGGSSDSDSFVFAYSTDDASYVDMFTVNSTSDSNIETFDLPGWIEGTVYVRVTDTDRSPGARSLDTIYVDYMYIHSESQPGEPPAPISLNANGSKVKGFQTVDLTWSGGSATSFDIYRDGTMIASNVQGTRYTDEIGKGGGSYQYWVCEASNPANCSNIVQVDL